MQHLEVPEVRRTFTVLGCSTGGWGYQHGVNEHGVAVGRAPLQTRLRCERPGLLGEELVRLTLERARTAQQAVELLTDFIRRYGQGSFPGGPDEAIDSVFLIADGQDAFAVEAGGPYYVWQQVRELRVLGPVGTVRQDWDWISPGLSEHILGQGWWPADGSKVDFAGCVCPPLATQRLAAHRWGRTTVLMSEQAGHIDVPFLRRVLSDVEEGADEQRMPSLVMELHEGAERPLVAWTALGPTRLSVFFPLLLEGELPAAFAPMHEGTASESHFAAPHRSFGEAAEPSESVWQRLPALTDILKDQEAMDRAWEALDRLQARFDQEAEDFVADAVELRRQGRTDERRRQATLFMQHCLERFEEVADGLTGRRREELRGTLLAATASEPVDVFEG
jgi:hypothetical protein